ncbi:MAG: ABC transporter permease [Acidimicrobiia bacterium]
MRPALRVEWWKLKRSPVTVATTALMVVLLPLMAIGFYTVAQQGGTGALGQKAGAMLLGTGWEGYLSGVDQIAAVAGFIGAGVVVAWAFGREHSDRTFASLFALPVSRGTIAGAKFVVLACWVAVLSLLMVITTFLVGVLSGVGSLDEAALLPGLARLLVIVFTTGVLALSIALVASIGRGYLPAIGGLILIVAAAQIAVLFGTGGWFPYAVPGLLAVPGEGIPAPSSIQMALIPVLTGISMWMTMTWWQRTEVG